MMSLKFDVNMPNSKLNEGVGYLRGKYIALGCL